MKLREGSKSAAGVVRRRRGRTLLHLRWLQLPTLVYANAPATTTTAANAITPSRYFHRETSLHGAIAPPSNVGRHLRFCSTVIHFLQLPFTPRNVPSSCTIRQRPPVRLSTAPSDHANACDSLRSAHRPRTFGSLVGSLPFDLTRTRILLLLFTFHYRLPTPLSPDLSPLAEPLLVSCKLPQGTK